MHCENFFCIYWKESHCILNQISLDIQGSCQSCIYVNIDEHCLNRKRIEGRKPKH